MAGSAFTQFMKKMAVDKLVKNIDTSSLEQKLSLWAETGENKDIKTLTTVFTLGEKFLGFPSNILKESMKDCSVRKLFVNSLQGVQIYGYQEPLRIRAPFSVVYNLSNVCNLKCKHCFQRAGEPLPDEMSDERKLEVVKELCEAGLSSITFSGGEPLMYPCFFDALRIAKSYNIFVSIDTNGTLIDRDMALKLRENGLDYAQVSIDGINPETHDEFRGVKGSWEKAVQAIKNLNEVGVVTAVGVTLHKYNMDEVFELIDFSQELKSHRVVVFPIIPVGRADEILEYDIDPQTRWKLYKKLAEKIDETDIDIICETPHFEVITSQIKKAKKEDYKPVNGLCFPITTFFNASVKNAIVRPFLSIFGGCPAGRYYCNIQPNGIVSPCMFSPYEPVAGNVKDRSFMDIWDNSPLFNDLRDAAPIKERCKSCKYYKVCGGGCRAYAYSTTKDPLGADKSCPFLKTN